MRKLPAIAIAAALTIAPLTACGDDTSNESATAACVDAEGVRLPDSACESGDSGNQWLWFLIGTQIGGSDPTYPAGRTPAPRG